MTGTMLPTVWTLKVGPAAGHVADVEALCRGVIRELTGARSKPDSGRKLGLAGGAGGQTSRPGQGGRVILEPVEYEDSLLFLLAETKECEGKFDVTRPGMLFRPWLYQRLRWALIDEWRSPRMFGRHGQHRVPHSDEAAAQGCDPDAGDATDEDLRVDRLREPSGGDPADRSDADRWLDADGDRDEPGPLGGLRRLEDPGAQVGVTGSGALEAGRPGRGAAGACGAVAYVDCDCGWRSYRQAPNGVTRWHWPDACLGCGRALLELVESVTTGSGELEESERAA